MHTYGNVDCGDDFGITIEIKYDPYRYIDNTKENRMDAVISGR
jgi:hypothetical protein